MGTVPSSNGRSPTPIFSLDVIEVIEESTFERFDVHSRAIVLHLDGGVFCTTNVLFPMRNMPAIVFF
ncbi:MAG: hypothetical protein F6K28_07120 [Microcoleus sp. SIO2G3]|nr:hypothetical protein [Microcoleus sp. SIO2G3]